MQARIYQPAKSSMQSGTANCSYWLIEFSADNSKAIEPIMGWTSSKEMLQEVKLKFHSKEAAVDFANANNYSYQVIEPKTKKLVKRSYADNFK